MLDHIVFSAGSDTSISMLGQMMLLALLFWLGVLWCVLSYPGSAGFWGGRLFRLIMGVCVLLPAWSGLVFLKQQHEDGLLVLWLVGIVAMADMGAYFVGVRFGQHKLAPQVSPGKSWEGVAGGVLANLLFAVMLSLYLNTSFREGLWMGLTMIAVGLASILGDLFESMLKRYGGIKDSGTLLPGHGGVLDRIDGWMAAVPVFVFVYLYGIGLY
jgi:phosphatidate cytidylyltransferase